MKVMENPTRFNPATQKNHKTNTFRGRATERMCNVCRKWFKLEESPVCVRTKKCRKDLEEKHGIRINTGECYKGWYEHLGPTPVWIESKVQLYHECMKRGLSARALESGGVMKRPRGA